MHTSGKVKNRGPADPHVAWPLQAAWATAAVGRSEGLYVPGLAGRRQLRHAWTQGQEDVAEWGFCQTLRHLRPYVTVNRRVTPLVSV